MGVKQLVRHSLETLEDHKYEKELKNRRGSYKDWLGEMEPWEGGELDTLGVEGVADRYFQDYPGLCILYGDEDLSEDDSRLSPQFRPDWSPELFESRFYVGSCIAVRRTFAREVLEQWQFLTGKGDSLLREIDAEDGVSYVFVNENPNADYIAMMRFLFGKAGGWKQGCTSIGHLSEIWHHHSNREAFDRFVKDYDPSELYKLAEKETAVRKKSSSAAASMPLLSVIIPSKDNPELLAHCLKALQKAAGNLPYEAVVVDNGSTVENRHKIGQLEGIRYLYQPMEFDFAKMCNLGASAAAGQFLLFLNDDVELTAESNLRKMEELAGRPGVGSVGLKLYYPNSKRIQHAGITNLPMGPVHKLQFLEDDREYYLGMNRGLRNVLAVSAACVMIRCDRFREAGGFEESLKVAFNDVALGFRLFELGYRNICMCDGFGYHHESLTRGGDDSPEKLERLLWERKRLYELFPALEGVDPYYSAYLGRDGLDTGVRPGYETIKNACQIPEITAFSGEEYRPDPCLRLAVEDERGGVITGYGIVLGDDNACYEKQLLLQNEVGKIFCMDLEGMYRPDLAENLPDQKNVALCGFWVNLGMTDLPEGTYRIGCAAKHKFASVKLISWSNRKLLKHR